MAEKLCDLKKNICNGGDDWPDMTDATPLEIFSNRVKDTTVCGYKTVGTKQYIEINGTLNFNSTQGNTYQLTISDIPKISNVTKCTKETSLGVDNQSIDTRLIYKSDVGKWNVTLAVPLAINLTNVPYRTRILLEQ